MSFTTWSIRNPAAALLLFLFLSLTGAYCFHRATLKNMPDFNMNRFSVALSLPGAAPEQLENEVAIPVENSFSSLKRLESIGTSISEGNVRISLHFSHQRSVANILLDIKSALSNIRPYLPKDLERARIHHLSASVGYPSAMYAATNPHMSRSALTWFVANTVYRKLSGIKGLRKFEVVGGVNRDVEVVVNPAKLNALGLTVSSVSHALRVIEKEQSGGEAHIGGENQGVRMVATVGTLTALKSIPLTLSDGQQIPLSTIARVRFWHSERATVAQLNDKAAVGFRVYDETGDSELKLIKQVAQALKALSRQYPEVHFTKISSFKGDILSEYHQSIRMLIEGSLLAILVILLFLRSWRSTLIGAIALPLSVLPTFIFIYLEGYGLNIITLLALLVVTGILVDDAIVEIENIHRHLVPGVSLREATIAAVNDIGMAVISTSLVLLVVFIPTSFMTGFTGELFREFGWTACAAVLASLLVARVITPVLAVWILERAPPVHRDGKLSQWYGRAVSWSIRHKTAVLLGAALVVAGSIYLYTTLPTGFIPPSEEDSTTVSIRLAPGATIPEALKAAAQVRKAIMQPHPVAGVAHIFTRVGDSAWNTNGGPGILTDIRRVTLTVSFTPRADRPKEAAIEAAIRKRVRNIPGMQISINGSGFDSTLPVTLAGPNPAQLRTVAQAVEQQMHTIKGLSGISSALGISQTDVLVRPKPAVAAALGVTTEAIANTVRIATSGDYAHRLARLQLGDRRLNIRVRLPTSDEHSLSQLGALKVPGRFGLVPLSAVATLSFQSVPLRIERYNREEFLSITADLDGMPVGEAFKKIDALPAMQHLPRGVFWVKMGETRLMQQLFSGFGKDLALSTLFIYILLTLLFKDPFQPLTVICAVPLCLGGALLGVWLTGTNINMPVFLGFVLLLGLASKNSILLIDYAEKAIARGMAPSDAITEACSVRARPILMTTVAMIAGMIPLMVSVAGEDVSFSSPLAATVIGGLIGSTLLSLFVVPVVFLLVYRAKTLMLSLFKASEG